jgi:vacuolar-type H+-ATPase subunit I/STV1
MKTSGWVVFAAVIMVMAGIFGVINGLIAIIHDEVYVVGEDRIVAFDFTQWGWIHLILGVVVFLGGLAVTTGALWARLVGVVLALMHATSQIAWIEAYPFWAIVTIGLDIIVIFALLVHGEEEPATTAETRLY